ncbi:PKD domain-containing protein [Chitinophaga horti]|uniref:PKD domain-containing protein n=1 Tax=Chitinophaga horti TaxID=2920382 RepID=A0ABY6J157_9BACT|nr:PKD domain-containing protein [Chitinophaga horti]UYQ91877.1 PKD domain-containing protein [Chitinophaga horti]
MSYRFFAVLSLLISCGLYQAAFAQLASDTLPATVHVDQSGNKTSLRAELRPLRKIAGAPDPFYTYFWEFGDGTFSFEKDPVHIYKDTGDYDLRLWATNNYDDGRPPTSKPRRVKVKTKAVTADAWRGSGFFKNGGVLDMKINRMPRPGEDMVAVLGYRNPGATKASGSLLVFYNEKQFKKDNFKLEDARTYHREKRTTIDEMLTMLPAQELEQQEVYATRGPSPAVYIDPSRKTAFTTLLAETQSLFREQAAWRFDDLQSEQEQFLFLTLRTTPEMIKDTNATVTISAIFVPDDIALPLEKFDMEMQIVASHDPNRMRLRNKLLNYRFVKKSKQLNYHVEFQNTGKGPASMVKIGVTIPSRLDAATLEVTDFSPKCVMCDSAYAGQSCLDTIIRRDSVFFVFRNIYLPGMQQEGVNEDDSTKGFVKYRIRFLKDIQKLPFKSQASIVFDKNEPVITNKSVGRWQPGLSAIGIAGYRIGYPKDSAAANTRDLVLGAALSTYSPWRFYLQPEIYFNVRQRSETLTRRSDLQRDTSIGQTRYLITSRSTYAVSSALLLDVVPVHLRYNVNRFIGVGAGASCSITAFGKTYDRDEIELAELGTADPRKVTLESEKPATKQRFEAFNSALFADVNLGMARVGPALGVRYYHYLEGSSKYLFLYATWRF